ncbi:hypothetical protein B5S29_g4059 [[Candida] boidinii]|nr:hypothetical protein B5S29_g4059 [[Candida] boidinii]
MFSISLRKWFPLQVDSVRNYATRRRVPKFVRNQRLQFPSSKDKQYEFPKKSVSKGEPSKVPHTNPDSLPPYKFGSYAGLKLPDEEKRKGIQRLVSKITDFKELKINEDVRNALIKELKNNTVLRSQNYISSTKKQKTDQELNGLIIRPTPIQAAAIKIMGGKKALSDEFQVFTLAAETGSGKTWAYLAPLLNNLYENRATERLEQQAEYGGDINRKKAGIQSIVLVPTHELVDQVYQTLENVAGDLNLKPYKWDTNSNFKDFIEHFRGGIDILVTTPGKLLSLTRYDSISNPRMILGSTRYCVVDEADTLMDGSWIEDTYGVAKLMTGLHHLVFVSATIPSEFNKTISKLFPKATAITTPSLHKLPKAIEFRVINASVAPYKGSKMKALAQALYAIHCDGTEMGYEKRVIVFVDNKADCEKVAEKLQTKYNNDVRYISSEDDIEQRKEKVKEFVEPPQLLEDPSKPTLKVLVCTDLLSRGLNFTGIRNVILLDVPKSSVDLVHRAGRTGRMNQSGRVFLIMNDQDKSHVRGLPKVIRNGRRLA